MKKLTTIYAALALLIMMVCGCGLVSGTLFVSQELDTPIHSEGGATTLDDNIGSALVDLTDNSDYGDIDVNGIEAGCVSTFARNCNPSAPISGEVWVTLDTLDHPEWTAQDVRDNSFRVFQGMFLAAGDTHTFTCQETLDLIENLDQFSNAVAVGKFRAWGIGDQDVFCIDLQNIFIGLFLTGSLN
jgi:hypothetical protein